MQPICYNSKILVNRNVITWKDASILFIQNFYENGQIMNWSSFKQKNEMNNAFFFKWRQILDAIPREWKRVIVREVEAGYNGDVIPEPHL